MDIYKITMSEAISLYLEYLKQQGKSQRTLYTYGKDLEQIIQFFGTEKQLVSITLPQVGKFYQSDVLLRLSNGKQRSPQTVSKTLRVFRMFMIWAMEHHYIE